MSGLCSKSYLLRSLLPHCSPCCCQGQRLGRAFTAAEVSRGEGSKKSWTKPCWSSSWQELCLWDLPYSVPFRFRFYPVLQEGECWTTDKRSSDHQEPPKSVSGKKGVEGSNATVWEHWQQKCFVPSKKNLVTHTHAHTRTPALLLPCTFVHPPSPPQSSPRF